MDLGDQPCEDLVLESVDNERRRVLTFELEAAQVLAGLARSSSLGGGGFHGRSNTQQNVAQGEATNAKQFYGNSTATAAGLAVNDSKSIGTASRETFVASHNTKVPSTSRQKLTEAEKEARRVRRVLSNRESARQTIRRRQAMHLELTGKAADLTEVNLCLKKEKELAMKRCNSLKDENQYLKAQVAKTKRAEPEKIPEQPKSPRADKSRSAAANAHFFSCNPPPAYPFLWPSQVPSSENMNSRASIPGCMGGLPFRIPMWDEFCSNHGLSSSGTNKQGAPMFIMPIPLLLPFLTHHGGQEYASSANDAQYGSSNNQCHACLSLAARMHDDYHRFSSHQNTSTSNASKLPSGGGTQVEDPHIHPARAMPHHPPVATSAPEQIMHGSREKARQGQFICDSRKLIEGLAATNARRRRKEMLKLKNIRCHDLHSQ